MSLGADMPSGVGVSDYVSISMEAGRGRRTRMAETVMERKASTRAEANFIID